MRKSMFILALLVASTLSAQFQRGTDAIRPVATSLSDPAQIDFPASGVSVAFLQSKGAVTWKVNAVTLADRPWTDTVWLAAHDRYRNGAFDVTVFRAHPGSGGAANVNYCGMQTFQVLAQANQNVTVTLDPSKFGPTDHIFLELWPGYDAYIDGYDSNGAQVVHMCACMRSPGTAWTHIPRTQQTYTNCIP